MKKRTKRVLLICLFFACLALAVGIPIAVRYHERSCDQFFTQCQLRDIAKANQMFKEEFGRWPQSFEEFRHPETTLYF